MNSEETTTNNEETYICDYCREDGSKCSGEIEMECDECDRMVCYDNSVCFSALFRDDDHMYVCDRCLEDAQKQGWRKS